MRLPSGTTDQYIYFTAINSAGDRVTGLSTFTVYRSRNGGAATAFTTPTINETDATNMPGVYELLLDEDMTIDSGDDSQEMVVHISHAGMLSVTRAIELYRRAVTGGETLTVSSGAATTDALKPTVPGRTLDVTANGNAGIDWGNVENPTSTVALTNTSVDVGGYTIEGGSALQAIIVGSTISQAGVRAALGMSAANLDAQLSGIDGKVDTVIEDVGTLQSGFNTFSDKFGDPVDGTFSADLANIKGVADLVLEDTAEIANLSASSIPVLQHDIAPHFVFKFSGRNDGVTRANNTIRLATSAERPRIGFDTRTLTVAKPSAITSVEVLGTNGSPSVGIVVADEEDTTNTGARDWLLMTKITGVATAGTYRVRVTFTAADSAVYVVEGSVVVP